MRFPFVLAIAAIAPHALAEPPSGYVGTVLPNGLEVTIVPAPANPVVAINVWYHVGAANETPATRGFAHLFEHLMFGGTATHDRRDFPEWVRRFGGYDNAHTSWDETVYETEIPPEGAAGVYAFESDRMVHLKLDTANLENEKRIVTEELRVTTENEPFVRAGVAALKAVLGNHPYAVSPAGTKDDIAAASLDHARDFYARYYRPRNAHVVVVGPVDAQATLDTLRRDFGDLPADGETPPDVPPIVGWPSPDHVALKEDIPPVKLAITAYALPPASDPDHWPLTVLTELMGGGAVDPFREILVRERRKALEGGVRLFQLRRGGAAFFFSASLPYRRQATAFRLIDEALQRLSGMSWLTDETVAAAKRKLLRTRLERQYSSANVAQDVGQARWWLGDAKLAFEETERLAGVTRADVARVYDRYIVHGRPVRLYVTPEKVPLWIRLFSWLYPVVS